MITKFNKMRKYLLILITLCILTSCGNTKLNQSDHVERDVQTRIQVQTQIDSVLIYKRDSIYIHEKNDTVVVEKWHTLLRYRDKIRIDTLHITDTLRVTHSEIKTIEVEVNRITGWQNFQIWAGRIFLVALLITIVCVFLQLRKKLS
jgi:hypothetical protein